jgi:hypothetical protein
MIGQHADKVVNVLLATLTHDPKRNSGVYGFSKSACNKRSFADRTLRAAMETAGTRLSTGRLTSVAKNPRKKQNLVPGRVAG